MKKMFTLFKGGVALLSMLLVSVAWAQETPGCGDLWYDSGGPTGTYGYSENETTTFCPDTPGEVVTLTFTYVDIETSSFSGCWDELMIYDGPDTSAPLLGVFCGEESGDGGTAGPGATNLGVGDSFTSTSESGCLTVVFTSDASVNETGWETQVSCGPPPNCTPPTVSATTEFDCDNQQYFSNLTVDVAGSPASSPLLIIQATIGGVQVDNATVPNTVGSTVEMGPFPSGSNVLYTINMFGFSCPTIISTLATCPPVNDLCADAIDLECNTTVYGSTIAGSVDADAPECYIYGANGPGVWYKYTSSTNAEITLSACDASTNFDVDMAVYTGECGALTCFTGFSDDGYVDGEYCEANDDYGVAAGTFTAEAGETYYIYVVGYYTSGSLSQGNFGLTITCVDLDCGAPDLEFTAVDVNGDPIEDCVPAEGNYYLEVELVGGETTNSSYSVVANGGAPVSIAANSNGIVGPFTAGMDVEVTATGEQYILCAVTETFDAGEVCPPINDYCVDAIPVTCGMYFGNTTGGTNDALDCYTYGSAGPSVWYTYTPEVETIVTLRTCLPGTVIDSDLEVLTGSCGELVCYTGFSGDGYTDGSSIPGETCPSTPTSFRAGGVFTAYAGETYYIHVSSYYSDEAGPFQLEVACQEVGCTSPDLTLTAEDANGDPAAGCLEAGEEYFVEATLSGGEGNTSYTVVANGTSATVNANSSYTFGPFTAGTTVDVTATGVENNLCSISESTVVIVCPPVNDLCADAIAIECDGLYIGNTLSGTPDPEECGGSVGYGNGVWYTYTTDVQTIVTLDACTDYTNFDADLSVFTGTCGALDCFSGFSDDGYVDGTTCALTGQGYVPSGTFTALAGQTYYILLSGYGSSSNGDFGLSVSCEVLTCSSPEIELTVADATGSPIAAGCVDAGQEYYVVAEIVGGSGNSSYSVNGGGIIMDIDAGDSGLFGPFTAGPTIQFTAVGNDDDLCSASNSIKGVCIPTNDLCSGAIALDCNTTVYGNTQGATVDSNAPACYAFGGNGEGVWYTYTAPFDAEVTLSTCDAFTDFDTDLTVYTGSCDGLTCFTGFSGDGYTDGPPTFGVCAANGMYNIASGTFQAEAGVTYYILVEGYYSPGSFSASSGNFGLSISCVDTDCITPELSLTQVDENGDPYVDCVPANELYYLEVTLTGGNSNNTSYSVTGNSSDPVSIDVGSSGIIGPFAAGADVTLTAVGEQYNLCVATTSFDAPAACAPVNDFCADALPLSCGAITYGNTSSATPDPEECGGSVGFGNGVWYTYSTDVTTLVTIDACTEATNFDADLSVYIGECGSLSCFPGFSDDGYNDGTTCAITGQSWVPSGSFTAEPGVVYYVLLSAYGSSSSGSFGLNVTCEEILCVSPEITLTAVDENGTPITSECIDVSTPYYLNVELTGGSGNDNYDVVAGSDTEVIPAGGSAIMGPFNAGALINVEATGVEDDLCGTFASYTATVCPVVNNDCADATPITVDGGVVFGSNIGATVDGPAMDCAFAGDAVQGDVWFSFVAPSSSEITIETSNGGDLTDTQIQVLDACDGNVIACDEDGGVSLFSLITMPCGSYVPGNTYYIQVDGYGGDSGGFGISVSTVSCPGADITANISSYIGCESEVTVSFYQPGTTTLVSQYTTTVGASGTFNMTDVETGTFDIFVKVDRHLQKGMYNVTIADGANTLTVGTIINGDVNNDNGINFLDASLISQAFNSEEGDPAYNENADLNCSGGVNFTDISILSPNFNLQGDAPGNNFTE